MMHTKAFSLATLFVTSLLFSACPDPTVGDNSTCTENATIFCSCLGGGTGTQICTAEGVYGTCQCDSNELSDGGTAAHDMPDAAVDTGPCQDNDNDGFYDCVDDNFPDRPTETDCDDDQWIRQPGGYEYPNNGIDDDCDGEVDETDDQCNCPSDNAPSELNMAGALGLCGDFFDSNTYEGNAKQKLWTHEYYGIPPKESECMAVLSTGKASAPFGAPTLNYYESYDYEGLSRFVSFGSNETGHSFQCQVDEAAPVSCTSPFAIPDLDPGVHELKVWATDAANNVDPIPLSFLWEESSMSAIEFYAPTDDYHLQAPPRALDIVWPQNNDVIGDLSFAMWGVASPNRNVQIEIKQGDESLAMYYVYIEKSGRWTVDQSIWDNENLSTPLQDGFYEVHLNIEESWNGTHPAESKVITVEVSSLTGAMSAPVSEIESIDSSEAGIYVATFDADTEGASFDCRIDFEATEGTWETCTSPHTFNTLNEGVYHFHVRASLGGLIEPLPDSQKVRYEIHVFALLSPANGSTTSESQPALIGSGEPGAAFNWVLTSSADATLSLTGEGTIDFLSQWSIIPDTPLSQGEYTLSINYIPEDNIEQSHSFTFAIDPNGSDTTSPQSFYSHAFDVQPGTDFEVSSDDPAPDGSNSDDNVFSNVKDLASMKLALTKPGNVRGFAFDFMFMSAEFPEFICQTYNDTFYAIIETTSVNGGNAQNITFDRNNNEVTVNNAFFEPSNDWSTSLTQSPYGSYASGICGTSWDGTCAIPEYCDDDEAINTIGSGTGWLTTSVPLGNIDHNFTLSFSVHDEGDGVFDSAALISNFRWVLEPTELVTEKEP